MRRGVFEEGGRLPIVSIFDINFAYDTNVVGHPTLSSDIQELGKILRKIKGADECESC